MASSWAWTRSRSCRARSLSVRRMCPFLIQGDSHRTYAEALRLSDAASLAVPALNWEIVSLYNERIASAEVSSEASRRILNDTSAASVGLYLEIWRAASS